MFFKRIIGRKAVKLTVNTHIKKNCVTTCRDFLANRMFHQVDPTTKYVLQTCSFLLGFIPYPLEFNVRSLTQAHTRARISNRPPKSLPFGAIENTSDYVPVGNFCSRMLIFSIAQPHALHTDFSFCLLYGFFSIHRCVQHLRRLGPFPWKSIICSAKFSCCF